MPLTTSDISDMTTKYPYQSPNPNMMNVRSQTPQRTLAMLTVQLIQVPVTNGKNAYDRQCRHDNPISRFVEH